MKARYPGRPEVARRKAHAYNPCPMALDASPFDQISDRVERLLERHEQLHRTCTLLTEQVATLTQERDSLRSRLQAARTRVDALIERLPTSENSKDAP